MQEPLDDLITLLDLEDIEVNIFRGSSPDEDRQRVFGGQVAGQALVAAARTVEVASSETGGSKAGGSETNPAGRGTPVIHSLHASFLRPGDPGVPILYEVDRIRDGRSFTTRRIVAIQHGRAIFHMSASFHVPEEGLDHQLGRGVVEPDGTPLPDPEDLPDFKARMAPWAERLGDWYHRSRPIDTRYVDWSPPDRRAPLPPRQRVWLRADGRLPDDPVLHTCVLAYASDMTLLDTALLPHGGAFDEEHLMMASLDHAMWFHRPFRADDWLLYDQDTPSASGARGLARGLIYDRSGALTVSVVQEGLIRVLR